MLNKLIEKNAVKCHQYWPDMKERELVFDDVSLRVRFIAESSKENYICRYSSLIFIFIIIINIINIDQLYVYLFISERSVYSIAKQIQVEIFSSSITSTGLTSEYRRVHTTFLISSMMCKLPVHKKTSQ